MSKLTYLSKLLFVLNKSRDQRPDGEVLLGAGGLVARRARPQRHTARQKLSISLDPTIPHFPKSVSSVAPPTCEELATPRPEKEAAVSLCSRPSACF